MGNNSSKKVRIGIIGVGRRGKALTRHYLQHPKWEVVAICDNIRPVVDKAAAELNLPDVRRFTSVEKLLQEGGVDAVLIATPPDMQVDIACYAMEKGVHVTTEVPAAYTIKQCWDLVRTVEKTGVKYQLAEQGRYMGFIEEWKKMAQRGDFGQILFCQGEYLHYYDVAPLFINTQTGEGYHQVTPPTGVSHVEPSWRFRTNVHPIYYLPHTLSPLLSITGGRVTRVSCMGTRPQSYHLDGYAGRDMEVALMQTDNDAIFRVAAGFTSLHGPRKDTECHWYNVKGTKREVEWARSKHDMPKMWSADDPDDFRDMDWGLAPVRENMLSRESGHNGLDWWPIDTFVEAILNDAPLGMDVFAAVETAAPAILAAESSEEGGTLKEVPDFRKQKG